MFANTKINFYMHGEARKNMASSINIYSSNLYNITPKQNVVVDYFRLGK